MDTRLFINETLYCEGLVKPEFRGKIHFLSLLAFPIYRFYILNKYHPEYSIYLKPVIISYIIVLFASSSNPYFTSSFDFLWMLFLPIGILNRIEIDLNNKKINTNS